MPRYSSDPFMLTTEDGVRHAVKGNIKVSVLPDVGEVKMMHKFVFQPLKDSSGVRILKMIIGDLKIFVNNDHFVITKKEIYPKLKPFDLDWCVDSLLVHISVDKDEKGRYSIKNEKNAATIRKFVEAALEYKNAEMQDSLNSNIGKLID